MTCNNPKLDLVNLNAYLKFCEIKGHYSATNARKMMCNNPKVDHVNVNAHTKFG